MSTNITDRRSFLAQSAGSIASLALLPSLLHAKIDSAEVLNVAVVGLGKQSGVLLAELAKIENVKVVALCDTDDSRLQRGLRRVQNVDGFADHKQMLEKRKDIGAVVIATPTHMHKDVAIDCIAAGKHIYCEAPLAHTVADAKAIAAAAAASKIVFAVGHEGRSNPIYKLARTFYKGDAIRELIGITSQWNQKNSWKIPSDSPEREKRNNWRLDEAVSLGLAGECGSHQFDVMHWYTGKVPVKARASGSTRLWTDGRNVHDTIHADLIYADGVSAGYSATLGSSYGGKFETFHGSNSAIKLAWTAGWMFKESDAPTQGWEVYANRQQFHNDEGITLIADATKLAAQGKLKDGVGIPNPTAYYSLTDFAKSVLEGKPAICSTADGIAAVAISAAIVKSIASGNEVAISADDLKV